MYFNQKKSQDKGFSIMELLVVIAIIGLLATFATFSYSESRKEARDKIRMSELEQIKTALVLYKAEHGNYPFESDGYSGGSLAGIICTDPDVCSTSRMNTPINQMLKEYLGEGVADPLHNEGGGTKYWYYYDGRKNCTSNYHMVTVHARQMETDDAKNIDEIQSKYCDRFDTSANEGNGLNSRDAYLLIVDYLDASGTAGEDW